MKPTSVPRHQNVQTNNLQCLNSLRTWQDIPEHELSSLGRRRKKCMSEVRKFKPLTHRDPLMRSNLLLFQLTYHHTSTQLSKTLTQPCSWAYTTQLPANRNCFRDGSVHRGRDQSHTSMPRRSATWKPPTVAPEVTAGPIQKALQPWPRPEVSPAELENSQVWWHLETIPL